MNQDSSTDRRCFTCGATAGEDDIYCRHCGSRLPARSEGRSPAAPQSPEPPGAAPFAHGAPDPAGQDDDSIYASADPDQETASRETIRVDQSGTEPEQPYSAPISPPSYEPAAPSPPPRSRGSNRVWWIVGGVILLFILLCCCMIMLIAVVAGSDEGFQDELQSVQPMISALLR